MNKSAFLLAIVFLTRVPVPIKGEVDEALLNHASRYFSLVGLLIGLFLAVIYFILQSIFPVEVAVILTLAAGVILTGAFHEDGFADVWDGFGGGWSVEQKLTIMKDSRLGTYGAAALCLLLLLKYQLLVGLAEHWYWVCIALICGHTLSRTMATSLIGLLPYVQQDMQSKVKPIVQSLSKSARESLYGCALAVLLVCWGFDLFNLWHCVTLVGCLVLLRSLCIRWFRWQLGGYTGDCLGAAQQCAEVVVYMVCLLIWL
ncbi:adenosylcobinamide-GDP ribazoletransferase [Pseudoalteromonas sp. T1lg23B]|uniref:adenosylcobinamide-GDP ribazoletransferase n=1 Tax=Pseudoalteromonas sp. T1lg23B TaxID=2077097 RepID=UPI000CF71160|nr:adenosylcobinamide-GDP ribazoletransferase [Pseudoalteromonas sp. T1lg23B]